MVDVRKSDYFRESRKHTSEPQPVRALPLGTSGGNALCTVAGLCYAMTGHSADGKALEALVVMVSPGLPVGMFYSMTAPEARMFGETLLRIADELGGPKMEPEVEARRNGG